VKCAIHSDGVATWKAEAFCAAKKLPEIDPEASMNDLRQKD